MYSSKWLTWLSHLGVKKHTQMCIFCYRALLYNFVIKFKYRCLSHLVWGDDTRGSQRKPAAGHMYRGIAYGGAWATCSVLWPAQDHKCTLELWSWVWGWFKSKWEAPCKVIYSPTGEGPSRAKWKVISRQLGRQASSRVAQRLPQPKEQTTE